MRNSRYTLRATWILPSSNENNENFKLSTPKCRLSELLRLSLSYLSNYTPRHIPDSRFTTSSPFTATFGVRCHFSQAVSQQYFHHKKNGFSFSCPSNNNQNTRSHFKFKAVPPPSTLSWIKIHYLTQSHRTAQQTCVGGRVGQQRDLRNDDPRRENRASPKHLNHSKWNPETRANFTVLLSVEIVRMVIAGVGKAMKYFGRAPTTWSD